MRGRTGKRASVWSFKKQRHYAQLRSRRKLLGQPPRPPDHPPTALRASFIAQPTECPDRRSGDSLSAVADCIFCAIAAGEAPATIIDEDADTVAFMDINPWQRGHALVVPRRHYENLLEIEPEQLTKTFATAQRLAARMKERLGADGVVLWNSTGEAAGQVVMHFHVHVIPTEGEPPPLPRQEGLANEADIAAVAATLRGDA
jgi:histidine triad (HIT) family protein